MNNVVITIRFGKGFERHYTLADVGVIMGQWFPDTMVSYGAVSSPYAVERKGSLRRIVFA